MNIASCTHAAPRPATRLFCSDCQQLREQQAEQIIEHIAKSHDVTPDAIRAHTHSPALAIARRESVAAIRNETQLSWHAIARLINRSHGMVIHHYRHHLGLPRYGVGRKGKRTP